MTDAETLADLRTAADYQFGRGAGEALFPPGDSVTVRRSSGGRPRQVIADGTPDGDGGERLASYGTDGRFTLGLAGGLRLRDAFDAPRHRAVVGAESEPFVREGRSAFAKFVRSVDDGVRPGDEVLIVDETDAVFGVGRAELSGAEAEALDSGVAVETREGNPDD